MATYNELCEELRALRADYHNAENDRQRAEIEKRYKEVYRKLYEKAMAVGIWHTPGQDYKNND